MRISRLAMRFAAGLAGLAALAAFATGSVVLAQSGGGTVPGIFHSFSPPTAAKEADPLQPIFGPAFQRGRDAFRTGDFGSARKHWEGAAEDGDLFAQWHLANMHRLGQGVDVDHAAAFRFYAKVAAQHSDDGVLTARTRITVDAMVRLADYYRTGIEGTRIKKNQRRAFRMHRMAATHYGHPGAQFALGQMHCLGEGVSRSTERCMRWYMLAARKGHAIAQSALGDLYWEGAVLGGDRIRALAWYGIALKNAPTGIRQQLTDKFEKRKGEVTKDERRKAEELARRWQSREQARAN